MAHTKKYSYIDSLRGYAVLMVLAVHVYYIISFHHKTTFLSNVWSEGKMGVMLFFMISALTLFLSLDSKINIEKYPIRNFFIRRFFRIAPLFYIVLCGYLFFEKAHPLTVISTFTFTNGFFPGAMRSPIILVAWTLAIEMVFYVILPVLFKYIKTPLSAFVFFFLALLISIAGKYLMLRYCGGIYSQSAIMAYTYVWLPMQLPVFALGIILYFILFKTDFMTTAESQFKKHTSILLIFSGVYFFVISSFSNKLFINENLAFSFSLLLFILGLALNPLTIFNNKFVQFLGTISYSFYLLHMVVITIIMKLNIGTQLSDNQRFVAGFFIVLLITSAIAYISYLLIEKPFQKLGARLIEKLEAKKVIQII